MGTVFEAVDRRFGNHVAVKRLDISGPAVERAFEREARLLRNLKHDGLPRVIDHFEHERSAYLVMDYVHGEDLSEALQTRGHLPVAEVVDIGRAALGILEYLHGRTPPVLHRDIKPQNLKVHDGQVYLLDFGLAKGDPSAREGAAGASSIAGYTPHYAPLEQMRGIGTSTWSDVYALAATLYCLLTGARPADALERATAAATGEADPLVPAAAVNAKVPESLSRLLVRCMSPNPNQRPRDASAMRSEFEQSVAGVGAATIVETGYTTGVVSDRTVLEVATTTVPDQTLVEPSAVLPVMKQPIRIGLLALWTVCLLGVVAIGALLLAGVRPWSSGPGHSSPLLVAGSPVERDIAPGERHEYHVIASTGDAIRVGLHRLEGGRFAVAVVDPSSTEPVVETQAEFRSRLPTFMVARSDGVHVVSVRLSKWSGTGRYRIVLEHHDGALAADLELVKQQAYRNAVVAFDFERDRAYRAQRASGSDLPSVRLARADEAFRQKDAERKAIYDAAAELCRTSSEPMYSAYAQQRELIRQGHAAYDERGMWVESPVRGRLLELFRAVGDIEGEATFLDTREGALRCAEAGRQTAEANRLIDLQMWQWRRANKRLSLDDANARAALGRALVLGSALGNPQIVDNVVRRMADLDTTRDRGWTVEVSSEAIQQWRAREPLNSERIAWLLWFRGEALGELARSSEAMADFQDAVVIYRELKMPASQIWVLRRLASFVQASGDVTRADALLLESRAIDPVLGALSDERLSTEFSAEISPNEPDPMRF